MRHDPHPFRFENFRYLMGGPPPPAAYEDCQGCEGMGELECPRCCGDGETYRDSWNYGHEFHDTTVRTCDKCDGEGVIECEECEGEGRVEL